MIAKFKNLHTKTGAFNFEGFRYEFFDVFETSEPLLIKHLKSQNNNWVCIQEQVDENKKSKKREALEAKAKELFKLGE